jgi:hypothetical protein
VHGFIVDSLEDAIAATRTFIIWIGIGAALCSSSRFTADPRWHRDHVAIYEMLLERQHSGRALTGVA